MQHSVNNERQKQTNKKKQYILFQGKPHNPGTEVQEATVHKIQTPCMLINDRGFKLSIEVLNLIIHSS